MRLTLYYSAGCESLTKISRALDED